MESISFWVKIGYHSRFNPECNKERGFKNQLYIELGLLPENLVNQQFPKGPGRRKEKMNEPSISSYLTSGFLIFSHYEARLDIEFQPWEPRTDPPKCLPYVLPPNKNWWHICSERLLCIKMIGFLWEIYWNLYHQYFLLKLKENNENDMAAHAF